MIISNFNEEAAKAIQFACERKSEYNPIYIYGQGGSGKTEIIKEIFNKFEGKKMILTPLEFSETNIEDINKNDLLIVEDIGLIRPNEENEKKLISLMNRFIEGGKQVVLTGVYEPDRLPFNEEIVNKTKKGIALKIYPLDDKDKKLLFRNYASNLDERVLQNLLESEISTVGEFLGYLNNIRASKEKEREKPLTQSNVFKEFIREIENDMPETLKKSSAEEELREEYRAKLYVWKMKGFRCDRVESVIDGNIEDITREFVTFTTNVQRLIELQRRYGSIDQSIIPKEEKSQIEESLFNPEDIPKLEKTIERYELLSEIRRNVAKYINWDKSFDDYVVSVPNKDAYDFVIDIIDNPQKKGIYLIEGCMGCGKTEIVNLLAQGLFKMYPDVTFLFYKFEYLISRDYPEYINENIDVLIIDDVDMFINKSGWEKFESIIKRCSNRLCIFTLTKYPRAEKFNEYVNKPHIVKISKPDRRILKKMLEDVENIKGIDLTLETGKDILDKARGGFYDLEALVSLQLTKGLSKEETTDLRKKSRENRPETIDKGKETGPELIDDIAQELRDDDYRLGKEI